MAIVGRSLKSMRADGKSRRESRTLTKNPSIISDPQTRSLTIAKVHSRSLL